MAVPIRVTAVVLDLECQVRPAERQLVPGGGFLPAQDGDVGEIDVDPHAGLGEIGLTFQFQGAGELQAFTHLGR